MLQTTDVHGWVSGHSHNPKLNADFGDYDSLVYHLQQRAKNENFELLLFDSGDVIEGTGLSDATPIHGQYIFPIFERIENYTALTIGNHDIGHASTVELMENGFIKHYNENPSQSIGKYLTANSRKEPSNEFLGEPYSIYYTNFGEKILLMGWIYNFTLNSINTDVVDVSDALNQQWFIDAMNIEDIDMIIFTMHIDPTTPPEMDEIYSTVRMYHPNTPFILFTGHRHILYYEELDSNSFTLESGKYFEVIGIVEFDLENGNFNNFEYYWMDTSVENFYNLSRKNPNNFLTEKGQQTKEMISYYTNVLHLNDTLGCSSEYFLPQLPIILENSLYNLYLENVLPYMVYNNSLQNEQFFIANTATLRYPLFKGRISVNDIYSIIPFGDSYVYYPNLSGTQLQIVVDELGKLSSPTLKITPYFDTHEKYDWSRPAYTHSLSKINSNSVYDLVCSEYDSETITPILSKFFNIDFAETYPTSQTSTTALAGFIIDNFLCSENCLC